MTWEEHADCLDMDVELFFMPSGRDPAALARCSACPVRRPCLEDALRIEGGRELDTHGIRGGMTPPQRIALFSRRESAASAFASLRESA